MAAVVISSERIAVMSKNKKRPLGRPLSFFLSSSSSSHSTTTTRTTMVHRPQQKNYYYSQDSNNNNNNDSQMKESSSATTTTATSHNQQMHDKGGGLLASRLGLDPSKNRFHAPLVYHEHYSGNGEDSSCWWPSHHTFPMSKFERIAHALLTHTSGSHLPRPLVRNKQDFFRPLDYNNGNDDENDEMSSVSKSTILKWCREAGIDVNFGHRFLNGQLTTEEERIIGFRQLTHHPKLIERTVLEVLGTILTCQLAYQYGIAANLAGGTHHASPTGGAGYTILNDLAIASSHMLLSSTTSTTIQRILVIDCDVHQGDGTAQFSTLWNTTTTTTTDPTTTTTTTTTTHVSNNNKRNAFFTLSIHCASNYPNPKIHKSTYDIGLEDSCTDEEYMNQLEHSVNLALEQVQPDLVLYDAGVDIYCHDKLGRLKNISLNGIRQRDRWILDRCVSSNIPVAAVIGGGYADNNKKNDDVDALARRHAIVHEECAYIWRKYKLWKKERRRIEA
eukprot:scaffold338_cov116-Cylindrotheca_fusiformis.AAC.21